LGNPVIEDSTVTLSPTDQELGPSTEPSL
jgi:hypothetical protein